MATLLGVADARVWCPSMTHQPINRCDAAENRRSSALNPTRYPPQRSGPTPSRPLNFNRRLAAKLRMDSLTRRDPATLPACSARGMYHARHLPGIGD